MSRKPELRPAQRARLRARAAGHRDRAGRPADPDRGRRWTTGRCATVSDLEDRTRLRPLAVASAATPAPRRRRRASPRRRPTYSARSAPCARPARPNRVQREPPGPMSRRQQTITWVLVARRRARRRARRHRAGRAAARGANDTGIPTVTDISATEQSGTVEFRWPDPGLDDGDRYQIQVSDGTSSIQLVAGVPRRRAARRHRLHHRDRQPRGQDRRPEHREVRRRPRGLIPCCVSWLTAHRSLVATATSGAVDRRHRRDHRDRLDRLHRAEDAPGRRLGLGRERQLSRSIGRANTEVLELNSVVRGRGQPARAVQNGDDGAAGRPRQRDRRDRRPGHQRA